MKYFYLTATILVSLCVTSKGWASDRCRQDTHWYNHTAKHYGRIDTDGILSAGELRNPLIDYDAAQRFAQRRGDIRFNNIYNYDAADDARRHKEQYRLKHQHSRWSPRPDYNPHRWVDPRSNW